MKTEEKSQVRRSNFSRLFPPAIEKLLDRLRVVKQKSVKSNYEWDQALVHDAFVQVARVFAQTAEAFGVKFEVLVDGTEVEYTERKSKPKK
jgi:hypothetical protein